MTIYTNPSQATVLGQSIQSGFGVQSGGAVPASTNPIVNPVPLAANIGGTNKTLLEACARGELPRNAQLSSVSGQSVSAGISALQGDGMSVDEGLSGGNGAQVCAGVAVSGTAGNPNSTTTAGINNQILVSGSLGPANLAQGPTPTNNESVVSAPTPGSTTVANVTLLANVYQG